jgi:hypothetical protein
MGRYAHPISSLLHWAVSQRVNFRFGYPVPRERRKQYEIDEVRTGRGVSRAMLFPKATQAALEANARTNREVMAIKRERWRLRGVC